MSEIDGSIEIRPDDKGGVDEIVGNGVLVHVERMNKASWFIILTRPDQTQEAFWLDGKGKVEFTMTESRPAPTTGPNAKPWTLTSSFAAGRLAGLREAAEVAWLQSKQGATHEGIRAAILALAGGEG